MIAPDSSVVVAAIVPWHVAHAPAREALRSDEPVLIAHVAFETTSALSRMAKGHRIGSEVVLEALTALFPRAWIGLNARESRAALTRAVSAGLRGGALYDALIAATARRHRVPLLSADRRAWRIYEALDADVSYVVS